MTTKDCLNVGEKPERHLPVRVRATICQGRSDAVGNVRV